MLRLSRACRSDTRLLTNLGKALGHVSAPSWFATSATLGAKPKNKSLRPEKKTDNLSLPPTAKSLISQNDTSSLDDDDDEELDTSWDDDPDLTIAIERVEKRPQKKESQQPTKKRPRPPSVFEHVVMRLCRDVPPGGRMQTKFLAKISNCIYRVKRRSADPIFLSIFSAGDMARKGWIIRGASLDPLAIFKMLANLTEYTRKIQKTMAIMLEDMACRNIAITLKRTEELEILKPELEGALLNLLENRKKRLKFDTEDLDGALNLMRLTSRMRDEYRQALIRSQESHVGSSGRNELLGHPYAERLADANTLLRQSAEWLVEAGMIRMELKIRKFDGFWELVEVIVTRAANRRSSLKRAAARAQKRERESNGHS
ncbi:hypothetical protein DL766_009140 [Monosporascus sp. MC13-8B]|uniref:Uncharacterized protein n=1 Tax=Monosporascus cannonballus TaxID=155416 RepID=A0ABY0HM09_9PEZI|nr:hypothetical protein DL762_000135 [Monosporascus cannonballus]RYO99308.1 hypothetical protein DL763_001587 [Monosporascus cannonballus]RYP16403.1 hypothetical protein DL766_009140 [Monosporascus sp. MC13-8B]